jgi:hypothetical protein
MVLMEAKTSFEEWGIDVPANVVPLLDHLSSLCKMFPTTTTGTTWAGTAKEQEIGKMKMHAMVSLITSFDTLQPPSSWVQSWVSLLTASPDIDSLMTWLQEQTGTSGEDLEAESQVQNSGGRLSIAEKQVKVEPVPEKSEKPAEPVEPVQVNLNLDKRSDLQEVDGSHDDDAEQAPASAVPVPEVGEQSMDMDSGFNSNSSTTTNQPADEDGGEKKAGEEEEAEAAKAEAAETIESEGLGDADGDETEVSKIPSMMGADTVNSFSMAVDGSQVFHLSAQDKTLGLQARAFTAQGMKSLELQVAAAMWKAFNVVSFREDRVLVNFMAENSRSRVQIQRPVPQDMKLPFAGPITQNPQVVS